MTRLLAWLLLLALPLTACAQAPAGPPRVGVDYEVLEGGQRWQQAPDGKIEVVEVAAHVGTMTLRRSSDDESDGHQAVIGLAAAAKLRILEGRADPALFHRVPERARLAAIA